MEWVRGETIGHGSFGKVDLAILNSGAGLMAVKSAPVYSSESLRHEREVLGLLGDSENVIRCFGDSFSSEKGERLYNIFLEYAAGGSLYDRVREYGGEGLSEAEVRSYARSVLSGLKDIHSSGFVHCDVKLQNILLCSENCGNGAVAKIADFGLAKKQNRGAGYRDEFRGTPLYMAPETVVSGEFESPGDIWAVGCAVVEMLTGAPAWKNESNVASLLLKISQQSPEIPQNLSPEIRDFLDKCFIRDAAKRWTAEMLLDHQFIAAQTASSKSPESEKATVSPRCPFDFPEFVTPTPISQSGFDSWIEKDQDCTSFDWTESPGNLPAARFRQLVSDQVPCWAFSSSWLIVR
uniref:Protein kinase domain-containing protein n=1 Tax=Kalanchoe fedtschenkoi TaxID=63787 RepID=A0A7N0TAD3_KALFE